jgi:sugar (pentulose or hexulose) kinase
MNQVVEVIEPDPAGQAAYERLYPIFEATYEALRPIYEMMSQLPG